MQWELEDEGEEWREPTRTARSGRDCLGGVKRGSHEEQQAQGVVGDICRCFEWQEEGVVEVVVSRTMQWLQYRRDQRQVERLHFSI